MSDSVKTYAASDATILIDGVLIRGFDEPPLRLISCRYCREVIKDTRYAYQFKYLDWCCKECIPDVRASKGKL